MRRIAIKRELLRAPIKMQGVRASFPRIKLEKPPSAERVLTLSILSAQECLLLASWEQAQSTMLRRAIKFNKQGLLSDFERMCVIDSLENAFAPQQHKQYFGWGGVWGIAGKGWFFSISIAEGQNNAR